MKAHSQTTLRDRVSLSGVGVHSGAACAVTLLPADPDTGIVFLKSVDDAAVDIEVPAIHGNVVATTQCTVLGSKDAGTIATIEHLMAAFSGLGIDNVLVELSGDEVPVMDGSSGAFVEAIRDVGIRRQSARRRYIKVIKPVRVEIGDSVGEMLPSDTRVFEVEIDFADTVIGRQAYVYDAEEGDFGQDIARARTFGFMADVEKFWAKGLALGASLENTVAIGEDQVINPEGLRFADEFVRHKVLDAIGDLMLAGAPILGHFRSYRGGHRLNSAVVEALLADRGAWEWSSIPARREATQADVGAMLPAAALGPNVT